MKHSSWLADSRCPTSACDAASMIYDKCCSTAGCRCGASWINRSTFALSKGMNPRLAMACMACACTKAGGWRDYFLNGLRVLGKMSRGECCKADLLRVFGTLKLTSANSSVCERNTEYNSITHASCWNNLSYPHTPCPPLSMILFASRYSNLHGEVE